MDNNPYLPGTAEEFITANLNLARSVAWGYAKKIHGNDQIKFDADDLLSIAYLGLVKAYKGFNPTGFIGENGGQIKFSTYAIPKMRGELQRHIRDLGNTIRRSRDGDIIPCDSLNRPITDEDKPIVLGETIPAETLDLDERLLIAEFLSQLTSRQQKIYKLRSLDLSQKKISEQVGLSQVQVSRIEKQILRRAEAYGKGVNEMESKYPDKIKERVSELALTNTAKEIAKIIETEFPDLNIPYTTIATWISKCRKNADRGGRIKVDSEVTERMVTPEEAERYGIKVLNSETEPKCEPECDIPEPKQNEPEQREPKQHETETRKEIKVDPDIKQVLTPNKTVKVRWLDGYLEEFDAQEVRAGAHLLWIELKNGDTRHIPLAQVRWFNGVA